MTTATPTRRLFDPNPATRLPYVPAAAQARDGILARWIAQLESEKSVPEEGWQGLVEFSRQSTDDSDCNEVDAAGTFLG